MALTRPGSGIPIAHGTINPTVTQSGARIASPQMPGMNSFSGLLLGRVIRVDPCNQIVDIALINGGIMHNVPVVTMLAGTSEGEYVLPNIKTPKSKDNQQNGQQGQTQQQAGTQDGQQSSQEDDSDGRVDWKDIKDADLNTPTYERDTWAIVGYVNSTSRTPVCLGFLRPHSTEISIKGRQEDKEGRIDYMRRLTSQAYELRTRGGVSEDNFPDGTHVRVGKPHKDSSGSQSGQSQQQAGTQDGTSQSQQSSQSSGDDYYDDDSGDPDARIKLGDGEYENKDKDDKPWKIKKSQDPFRWFVVHSSKTKLGIDENGRIHNQYYKNKDQESDAPDPTGDDGDNKFNHAHTDHHQTRIWRVGFGNPNSAPGPEDKIIDGENWYDPNNNRNRFHLPQPSDGTYNAGNDQGASGGGSGSVPMPGFGGGGPNTVQNGNSGVADFPVHTGEVHFQNQIGQPGGLATDSMGNYFPFATTDSHAISFGDHHHGEGAGAIDVLTGANGRFIAPTSGFVEQFPFSGAGNVVHLIGDNGIDYYSGHTTGIASGRVTAGSSIGAIAPLDSTAPFGPGSGKEDLLHGHYFISARGEGFSLDGHGTINPYVGSPGVVSGLDATAMANGGAAGSPPGTFGSVSDPNTPTGQPQPSEPADPANAASDTSETQTKWYTPAATPKGGGVPGKIKGIKAKPTDQQTTDAEATGSGSATGSDLQKSNGKESEDGSKSKDGTLIDSAAEDHEHRAFVADDAEIKDVGTENKGGTSDNLCRGDHQHKDTDTSDERLKNNLGVIQEVLPALRGLNVIKFTWNELALANGETNQAEQIGLVAQEVHAHFPELIKYDSKGFMHLEYKKLSAVLLKGLQETNDRLDRIEQMLGI